MVLYTINLHFFMVAGMFPDLGHLSLVIHILLFFKKKLPVEKQRSGLWGGWELSREGREEMSEGKL